MATDHGFCSIHKIAYNRRLDPTCPQCVIGRMQPPAQLDFDAGAQKPVDAASGAFLDPITLQPAK